LVFFVIFSSIFSISIFPVCVSTSTNTGFAHTCSIAFAVAIKERGVVITSSHSQIQKYFNTRKSAAVQDFTQTVYLLFV
jgi:hypothetical protein